MKAKPGSFIKPKELVGRHDIMRDLWRTLESSSVLLHGNRRIGKTAMLMTMQAQPPPGIRVVYVNCSAAADPHDLWRLILRQLSSEFHAFEKFKYFASKMLSPKDVASQIEDSVKGVADNSSRFIIVILDELSYPLMHWQPNEAAQVLDTLRAVRQRVSRLRIIISGSVSMNHVMQRIARYDHTRTPLNDLVTYFVPPLDADASVDLAKALLQGENVRFEDGVPETLALLSDGMPFYIHCLVRRLKDRKHQITVQTTREEVDRLLGDPHDQNLFEHYVSYLRNNLEPHQYLIAIDVLNTIAMAPGPISQAEIFGRLPQHIHDPMMLDEVLRILQLDQYIQRNQDGRFFFVSKLVERWWKGRI